MNRFILLSFAFLGLAFYELSGGSDFDPENARALAVDARLDRENARKAKLPKVATASAAEQKTKPAEPVATSVATSAASLNLVSFEAVARTAPTPVKSTGPPETNTLTARAARVPKAPLDIAALELPATTLPSIVFPGNTLSSAPRSSITPSDIRTIKGSLVNMRSGPGTDYDVVDQLTQATRVEVLTNNGNGWVELRPVGGGTRGWIAEFLLNEG